MNKILNFKNIQANIFLTIFQVVASALVLFLLYRYLFDVLGAEKIGLWSLLIGITAVSRIGELGLTGGVVKFISESVTQNKFERASKIVQTIFISLLILVSVLIFISYLPVQNLLIFSTKQEEIQLIKEILPFSFLSIFLMILIGVLGGSLEGIMLMGFKNLLLGLSHIFYLFLVYKAVPLYGLIGVAYAQCVQYLILLIVMWIVLRREIKELPILPYQWDFKIIKEMFSYSMNFQAISIVGMFWEPVIKIMMSYWGGLASLGLYEMANKLIVQTRSIIIEATKIVVPITAKNNAISSGSETHFKFVKNTMKITSFSSFYIFSSLAISIPLLSIIWFGFINEDFICFTLILLVGYFISTLYSPIFLINLGTGHVKQNLYCYIIMAITSVIFGNIFGFIYKEIGIVVAVSLSLILSALYLGYWYKKNIYNFGFVKIFSKYKLSLIFVPMLVIVSNKLAISLDTLNLLLFTVIFLSLLSLYTFSIFNKLKLKPLIFK